MTTQDCPKGEPISIPLYGGPLDGETYEFPNDHLFTHIPVGHLIKYPMGILYVVMMDGRAHYQASKEKKQ